MIPIYVVPVAGVVAILLVLAGFAVLDRIESSAKQARLPSSSIGQLPPTQLALNQHGKWQLRQALILTTQLCEEASLQPETRALLSQWLLNCAEEQADEARLLDAVSLVLIRAENEDNLVPAISTQHKTALKAWLNDYLGRR